MIVIHPMVAGLVIAACFVELATDTARGQDPSAGRTTPPASLASSAPAAAGATGAQAAPTTTRGTVPVAPSNTAVAPVAPGSTTTVPVTSGATTVVPVAPGTTSVIVQDPIAKDPSNPGAQITVPLAAADPTKPGGPVVVPVPGADPTKPGGTVTVVPEAADPNDPKLPTNSASPLIKPELTAPATETITTTEPTAPGASTSEPAKPTGPIRTSFFQAARDSLSGRTDYAEWRPVTLRTLFTEGWDEAWIGPPNGLKGGPRQGWIGAADGNFYRLGFFSFDYTRALSQGGDGYAGGFTLYTPLSRRLLLISQIPFVESNLPTLAVGKQQFPSTNSGTGSGGSTNHPSGRTPTGFGDLAFTPRVMLFEKENFSLTTEVTVQVPTGYRRLGAGQTLVTPGIGFWSNFAERWVLRGSFNTAIGTNPQAGGTTLVSQLAVGRTFTKHDVPIFGDFTIYLSSDTLSNVTKGTTQETLTPGFRTHLGKSFYFLGGLGVPVTGPRPYQESATFWIMKVY